MSNVNKYRTINIEKPALKKVDIANQVATLEILISRKIKKQNIFKRFVIFYPLTACRPIAIAVAVAVASALPFASVGAFVVAFAAVGVGAGAAAGVFVHKLDDEIDQYGKQLDALNDAPQEACLEIKKWMEDETIARFRDSVQAEGRQFYKAEVDAMRAWYEKIDERENLEKQKAAVCC
ncbi:MAG: hypothetical protein V3T17_02810 [Pseudomonadales bacterium]